MAEAFPLKLSRQLLLVHGIILPNNSSDHAILECGGLAAAFEV
jgi:hypothetical protein